MPAQRGPAILKVSSRSGVSLEVLDWGGSGSPIVFLAGGGNSTPHDFDELAPRFTNRHRVIPESLGEVAVVHPANDREASTKNRR